MADHVLTARLYFTDAGNAQNAYDHLKALADHAAAHDRQVGGQPDPSWARLHTCYVGEDGGDTARCATVATFVLDDQTEGADAVLWAPDQTVAPGDLREHDGVVYSCLQGHTTQTGWEPPATPALWEPV